MGDTGVGKTVIIQVRCGVVLLVLASAALAGEMRIMLFSVSYTE